MVRIIVCGSRTFNDKALFDTKMDEILHSYLPDIEIISGRARGADTFGEQYAKTHNIPLVMFPAQWNIYGKSAGYRRNAQMLDYAKQGTPVVIAFWDGTSRGTKNMIDTAKKAGAIVHVINY